MSEKIQANNAKYWILRIADSVKYYKTHKYRNAYTTWGRKKPFSTNTE